MAARAINSDWLNPRWRSLRACSGTGTTITGPLGPAGIESADRFRQHATQDRGGRTHLFVFQQVDEFAQPSVVTAVGHGSGQWRLQPPAQTTTILPGVRTDCIRTEQPLSARGADATLNGADMGKAGRANRQAGNVYQRITAKTTIGGKEGSEQTF